MVSGKVVIAYEHDETVLDFINIFLPLLANMILMPFGWMLPGGDWTQLILTTIIWLFRLGHSCKVWASFTKHHANMDVVAIGTATAYFAAYT